MARNSPVSACPRTAPACPPVVAALATFILLALVALVGSVTLTAAAALLAGVAAMYQAAASMPLEPVPVRHGRRCRRANDSAA